MDEILRALSCLDIETDELTGVTDAHRKAECYAWAGLNPDGSPCHASPGALLQPSEAWPQQAIPARILGREFQDDLGHVDGEHELDDIESEDGFERL